MKAHTSLNLYFDYGSPDKGCFCLFLISSVRQFTWISATSWAAEQPECLAVHHPERWSLQTGACSTPRHYGWPAADVLGWSWSSCCHGRRFLPTPRPQLPGTPLQQPDTLGHQLRFSRHSCLCASDDGSCRLGTEARHEKIGSCSFPLLYLPYHVQTWWIFIAYSSTSTMTSDNDNKARK